MILTRIETDHETGGNLLDDAGNAMQQGFEERRRAFLRFGALWAAHGDMMDAAVHPAIADRVPAAIAAAVELQREVEGLAALLAEREAAGDALWHARFARLRDAFRQQCRVEQADIIAALSALAPEQVAQASRTAGERLRHRG
ncbi:hypothetical protein [Oleisolibacter albus]|uniref:hypothetical protein n=1 Tax=Oleisolibacter albus TaxID=2171757 RepID=UPI0012D709E0|nr:hypothetical protein [Oleisolibacter albus]